MQIGMKEEVKDELVNLIQNSYYIDANFLNLKKSNNDNEDEDMDDPPKIKDILQKDHLWGCVCGFMVIIYIDIYCNNNY